MLFLVLLLYVVGFMVLSVAISTSILVSAPQSFFRCGIAQSVESSRDSSRCAVETDPICYSTGHFPFCPPPPPLLEEMPGLIQLLTGTIFILAGTDFKAFLLVYISLSPSETHPRFGVHIT